MVGKHVWLEQKQFWLERNLRTSGTKFSKVWNQILIGSRTTFSRGWNQKKVGLELNFQGSGITFSRGQSQIFNGFEPKEVGRIRFQPHLFLVPTP